MTSWLLYLLLGLAAVPFVYYFLALYSAFRFFRTAEEPVFDFTPPVSILKPVHGLDPEAYENFSSFCRQDYPHYEILFCVDHNDPAARVIERICADYPDRHIRIFYDHGSLAPNDKVARLSRLEKEARYEYLITSDSDVFAEPGYVRVLVGRLSDPTVGAVTCPYVLASARTFMQKFQSIGMVSDFYPGIFVARELDGIKFALGPTIATTKTSLAGFGGYSAIADRPADDLQVGRLITEQGRRVILLQYVLRTVPDFESFGGFLNKRMRWMTSMRHLRPWGHLGLIFTFGLPWLVFAVAIHPTIDTLVGYLGLYVALRVAISWLVGVSGFKQQHTWRQMPLIPLWDLQAFLIWLLSFVTRTIRWRGFHYRFDNGKFLRIPTSAPGE